MADLAEDAELTDHHVDVEPSDLGPPDAPPPIRCALPFSPLSLNNGKGHVLGAVASTEEGSDINFNSCINRAIYGVEHIYATRLEVGATYRVSLTPAYGFDAALYVFTDCARAAVTCVGGADDNYGGTGESLTFEAKTSVHFIAVDSHYPSGWVLSHGKYYLTIERLYKPGNDACGAAQTMTLNGGAAEAVGDTALASNSVELGASGCTSYGSPGSDLFYSVALSKGKRYAVTLTPGPSFDSMLYAFTACGSPKQTCAAGQDNLGTGMVERIWLTPASDATYTIGVDSFAAAADGVFVLSVQEAVPPANDTCNKANKLTMSGGQATVLGDTSFATGAVKLPASGCTKASTIGPDLFYSVDLVAGQTYLDNLIPSVDYNVSLYVLSSCAGGAGACVVGADHTLHGLSEQIAFLPKSTGTYIIGVGSRYDSSSHLGSGKFTLMVREWTPAKNDTCKSPQKMIFSGGIAVAQGDTFSATNQVDFSGATGCATSKGEGPDLFYSVDLKAGGTYLVEVAPAATATTYDAAVYVFTDCSDVGNSCLGGSDIGLGGDPETVLIKPAKSGAHIIGIDAYAFGQWGKFAVRVKEVKAPANDTCAKAQALGWKGGEAGAKGINTLASNTIKLPMLSSCTSAPLGGGDLFYSVALAGGKTYTITATPDKGFDLALLLLTGCGDASKACLAGSDAGLAGSPERIVFAPKAGGAYTVAVGTRYTAGAAFSRGSFTLQVREAVFPGNDTCAKAQSLVLSGGKALIKGDTVLATDTVKLSAKGCTGEESDGPDLFYTVSLDAGKTYTVSLFPDAGFDPMLYAFTGCGAAQSSCVAGKDNLGWGKAESIKLTPKVKTTYTIAVDSHALEETGTFTLWIK